MKKTKEMLNEYMKEGKQNKVLEKKQKTIIKYMNPVYFTTESEEV